MVRLTLIFKDKDTGAPIAFISFTVDGKIGASDKDGVAEMDLPEGTYMLRVRHPFYEPVTMSVKVPGSYTIHLRSVHL